MENKINQQQAENPSSAIVNIAFNIFIPAWILKNKSATWGAGMSLVIALAFPLVFFIYEYIKLRKRNWISVLGFVNTLFTGLFAILALGGMWFAIKEAFVPALIGTFVLLTALLNKFSLIEQLFVNPALMNVQLLREKLAERGQENEFIKVQKITNIYLSLSFYLSAILNFAIAIYVFKEIPASLSETERSVVLNEQISEMTWMGYAIILLPSMLSLAAIFWYLIQKVKQLTGLEFKDLMLKSE